MKRRGEITIFLVLILSVISAFMIELSDLEKRCISETEAVYAMDLAVRSCFAEYNRELFKRYHIPVIDSSYKCPDNGVESVKDHFRMYLDGNLSQNEICDISLFECGTAEDDNRKYLYEAAVGYAKENISPDPRLSEYGDRAYFLTYLLSVFGNCHDPSEGNQREGETEYLLYGYESDSDNISRALNDHEASEEGDYEGFLLGKLEEEDPDILRQRFADLVTEYMRANGSPGFSLQTCYHRITFEAGLKGRNAEKRSIRKSYSYHDEDI